MESTSKPLVDSPRTRCENCGNDTWDIEGECKLITSMELDNKRSINIKGKSAIIYTCSNCGLVRLFRTRKPSS